MAHSFVRGSLGAVLAYAMATQGAFADLTARDVWSDWRNYITGLGYEVSGTDMMSGNTLTVSDFAMNMAMPEDAGTVYFSAPELVFTENGDGTVSVTFPPVLPLRFEATEDGETVSGVISITQTDSALVISGSPEDMTYDYTAAAAALALTSLVVDGEAVPPEVGHLTMNMANVASRTRMLIGEIREYTQTMSAATLAYDVAFRDPDSDDMGSFTGALTGVSSQGSGRIPMNLDMDDFPAMIAAGFAVDAGFAYETGSTNMAVKDDEEDMTLVGSSQGGAFGVSMDAGRIGYSIAQTSPKIAVTSGELPFPVEIALAKYGFSIDMPVAKSDKLQPFAFGLNMADFTMSDMLWSMVDPAAVMPRDPATITVEAAGKVKLLVDLMDPEAVDRMDDMETPPAELHALSIPNLVVSMIGSSVTGNGDFTFDNSDLMSFDGIPAPRGIANLRIVGANALIDRLIQMGMLPEDQAMGMRMMLGMFAVPGDGPDTLNSTIEFNDQGQILANGQRIK